MNIKRTKKLRDIARVCVLDIESFVFDDNFIYSFFFLKMQKKKNLKNLKKIKSLKNKKSNIMTRIFLMKKFHFKLFN